VTLRRVLAGALAGLGTAFAGLALPALAVVLAWLGEGAVEPLSDVLALAGLGWLVSLGVPVLVPGGEFSVAPLGVTLLAVVVGHRAGRRVARQTQPAGVGDALALIGGAVAAAGALAAWVASAATTDVVLADPGTAAAGAGLVVALAVGSGVLHPGGQAPVADRVQAAVPARVRIAAPVALAGLVAWLAVAAGWTALALLVRSREAAAIVAAIDPGVLGAAVLLLISVVTLPVLVVWAGALGLGPGLSLGADAQLGPLAADPATLPGLPVLAAVPAAMPPAVGVLLVLTTWGAIAVAVVRALHRRLPADGIRSAGLDVLAVAGLVALGAAALTTTVTGGLGPGTLAVVGPTPWQVGLAAGGAALLGGGLLVLGRIVRRRGVAERSAAARGRAGRGASEHDTVPVPAGPA
jgi:hypothetical protein